MTLEQLRTLAESVRSAFASAVNNGADGKALAQRYDELQREITARIASGDD